MIEVRFFRNKAGRRLAYAEEGKGPFLVFPAWWVSHLERDAEDPQYRAFFGQLAEAFRVVRYDRLGVGLSDRVERSNSLEAELDDFRALMDHLSATQANLFGFSCGGPVALAYAATHPERVQNVVCYGSYLEGDRLAKPDIRQALASLVRAHWGLGSQALADIFYPAADASVLRGFAALQRDAADGETAARLLELTYSLDASPFVERVRAPVLVLHRREDRAIPYEQGRRLATTLGGARLITLEGNIHLPWAGDAQTVVDAVRSFASSGSAPRAAAGAELRRDGEVWTLRFAGRQALLRDAKGVADLARLLSRPGEELHVLDILGPEARTAVGGATAEPTLDRKALASYRRRLAEIEEALDEKAESAGEDERLRLEEEREALLSQISRDTGLGGRSRPLNDPTERARKTVTARIRDAIRRIEAVHPELGAHLADAIATGTSCAYRPQAPVRWTIRQLGD